MDGTESTGPFKLTEPSSIKSICVYEKLIERQLMGFFQDEKCSVKLYKLVKRNKYFITVKLPLERVHGDLNTVKGIVHPK